MDTMTRTHALNASWHGYRGMLSSRGIRVFLLDDHEMVRQGVRGLLELDPLITVVGEAGTVEEALRLAPLCNPTVAVLDVRLPDGTGIEVCRELKERIPRLKCLMMSSFSDAEAVTAAIKAGASGFVLKQLRGTDVVDAVRSVAVGGSALDSETTGLVMRGIQARAAAQPSLAMLTQAERQVLELVGDGLTNREIGERLHLAEKTVRNRVSIILNRLEMQHRTQAALFINRARALGN